MTAINIKYVEEDYKDKWDSYVHKHKQSTFFHLFAWRLAIEKTFKHQCYSLVAEKDNEIVGVLPLGHIKSMLFGNTLISSPFAVYGGILADNQETYALLRDEACQLARKLNVDHLELRNKNRDNPDWPTKELYVYFSKELKDNDDENLKLIPRKQRAMVRKAIKEDLEYEIGKDISSFYQAYSESVRNLGTPVFPKKLFQSLLESFPDNSDVLKVTKDSRLVASVLSFYYKDEVLPYYGGGTSEARALKANDFMYWALMQHATKKGINSFDYGRSKEGTGSYSFKKNWGFEPTPLYYEYYLVKSKQISEINPLNPKYQLFIKMWRKLPLWLSQIIGPFLAKDLG
ncbi:MAG: FemAB family PEP-CTERM system-associated protein [Gammaproteobacteria bacterium]|nr:FemAB family PEP-CTERM system-associated protein [Gammaproteobacteria bacterium]